MEFRDKKVEKPSSRVLSWDHIRVICWSWEEGWPHSCLGWDTKSPKNRCTLYLGNRHKQPDTAISTWGTPGLGGHSSVVLHHWQCLVPGPCLLLDLLMWLRNREEIFPRSSVRRAFTHLPQSIHLNCEYLLKVKCFSSYDTFSVMALLLRKHWNRITRLQRCTMKILLLCAKWMVVKTKSHCWKYKIFKNACYFPEEAWYESSRWYSNGLIWYKYSD